jgi:hypothetical protein
MRVRRARTSWETSLTIFAFSLGDRVMNHLARRCKGFDVSCEARLHRAWACLASEEGDLRPCPAGRAGSDSCSMAISSRRVVIGWEIVLDGHGRIWRSQRARHGDGRRRGDGCFLIEWDGYASKCPSKVDRKVGHEFATVAYSTSRKCNLPAPQTVLRTPRYPNVNRQQRSDQRKPQAKEYPCVWTSPFVDALL